MLKGAFYSCKSLGDITIPSSVTYISEEAFWSSGSLYKIFTNRGNTSRLWELLTKPDNRLDWSIKQGDLEIVEMDLADCSNIKCADCKGTGLIDGALCTKCKGYGKELIK